MITADALDNNWMDLINLGPLSFKLLRLRYLNPFYIVLGIFFFLLCLSAL